MIAIVLIWKKSAALNASRRAISEMLFVLVCAVVPWAVLTWDADKNAAVGCILVAPVVWLAILAIQGFLKTPASTGGPRVANALAAIALITAVTVQMISYTRHSEFARRRPQMLAILDLYDRIDSIAREHRWTHPTIANNSFADFLFPSAINDSIYERRHHLLGAQESLATDLTSVSPVQTIDDLSHSDFALIAWPRVERSVQSPFQKSMAEQRGEIDAYCAAHFRKVEQIRANGFDVTLFARN